MSYGSGIYLTDNINITLTLSTAMAISYVKTYHYGGGGAGVRGPQQIGISYSDDNSTWSSIKIQPVNYSHNINHIIATDNIYGNIGTAHKYYRLGFLRYGTQWMSIIGIELYKF